MRKWQKNEGCYTIVSRALLLFPTIAPSSFGGSPSYVKELRIREKYLPCFTYFR
jgi:hypothetical protein